MIRGVHVVRLDGAHLDFPRTVDLVTSLISRLAAQGARRLLVDGTRVPFEVPSVVGRLAMLRRWADAAEGRVRLAMLLRPEFIDPQRFGSIAAANYGLTSQPFEDEAEALAWLQHEHLA